MQDLVKLAEATENLVYFHTLEKAPPMCSQFLPKKPDHGFDSEDKKEDEKDAGCSEASAAAAGDTSTAETSTSARDSFLQHVHCECIDSLQHKVKSLQDDIACLQSERSVKQAKLVDERNVKGDFV